MAVGWLRSTSCLGPRPEHTGAWFAVVVARSGAVPKPIGRAVRTSPSRCIKRARYSLRASTISKELEPSRVLTENSQCRLLEAKRRGRGDIGDPMNAFGAGATSEKAQGLRDRVRGRGDIREGAGTTGS